MKLPRPQEITDRLLRNERGVTLVEVLIGMLIITLASIATLNFFSYGLGNMGKEGNRRAALERARERLEQVLGSGLNTIPPADGSEYWLSCSGSPCSWTLSGSPAAETVSVNQIAARQMVTTAQWLNDPSLSTATLDTIEYTVRVWFTPSIGEDNDANRVELRTLRTP